MDAVVYVISHDEVETLVKLAMKHNVVVIPYGGGTNGKGIFNIIKLISYTSLVSESK